MANEKKVKAEKPARQTVDLSKLELPAGDTSFTVELAEAIPAGKKALISGHLSVNIVDA